MLNTGDMLTAKVTVSLGSPIQDARKQQQRQAKPTYKSRKPAQAGGRGRESLNGQAGEALSGPRLWRMRAANGTKDDREDG